LVNATIEGNIFPATVAPSAEGIIVGFPPKTCLQKLYVAPVPLQNLFHI